MLITKRQQRSKGITTSFVIITKMKMKKRKIKIKKKIKKEKNVKRLYKWLCGQTISNTIFSLKASMRILLKTLR